MTKLEKHIALDTVGFFFLAIIFHVTYSPKYSIMDDIWNLYITDYLVIKLCLYSFKLASNRDLKLFLIYIAALRTFTGIYRIGHVVFGYDTLMGGPHLILLGISFVVSYSIYKFSNKQVLLLRMQKITHWLF